MKQWKKIAVIAGPLLVVGSVYAFASSGSNVSFSVHPVQGSSSKPDASSTTGSATAQTGSTPIVQNTIANNDLTTPPANVQNPFLVQDSNTSSNTNTNPSQQQLSTSDDIDWQSIRHLLLHATSQFGPIDINYIVDGNGQAKLDGHVEGKSIHLAGEQAKQACQAIVNQFQFMGTLQKVANDGSAQITLPAGVQIQTLQVQLDNNQTYHLSAQPASDASHAVENQFDKNKDQKNKSHGKGHQKDSQSDNGNQDNQGNEEGDD